MHRSKHYLRRRARAPPRVAREAPREGSVCGTDDEGRALPWASGPASPGMRSVKSLATAETYNLKELQDYFRAEGEGESPQVVWVHYPAYGGEEETMVFFFRYGVTVWWGSDRVGRKVLDQLRQFEVDPEPDTEVEWSPFVYSKEKGGCIDDIIYLDSRKLALKQCYSHAIGQSAKLRVFEDRIEAVINETKGYPEDLSQKGRVSLSQQQTAKLKGTLFLHRMNINLHSDILDTPDYFWEQTELEPNYRQARRSWDINRRVEILNQRLELVGELFDVLHDELTTRHATNLEWIVIWLVAVELLIGVAGALIAFLTSGKGVG